jgi:hypothetical protein
LALQDCCGGRVFLGTDSLRQYKVARGFDLARLLQLPSFCLVQPDAPAWATAAEWMMALRPGRLLPSIGVNDRNFARTLTLATAARQSRTLCLDGYFQQGWGWPEFAWAHGSLVDISREDLPATPLAMPDCAIHVRGGDFLTSDVHNVIETAFYRRAMGMLLDQQPAIRSAWIVTDDKVHAAGVRSALAMAYPKLTIDWSPDGPGGWMHDFALLRDAPSRILGNSTFSWWAAALDRQRGQTFSPAEWMRGVPRSLYLPWEVAVPV